MPHYQSKRTQPSRHAPAQSKKQRVWLVVAFIAGYFFSTLYDFSSVQTWYRTAIVEKYIKKQTPQLVAQAQTPPPSKPKFEFYTLLTKGEKDAARLALKLDESSKRAKEVAVAQQLKASQGGKSPAVVQPEVTSGVVSAHIEKYNVQLAAFNNYKDAEKMKAILLLKGFDVKISTIEQNHIQWYRVHLGPFTSKGKAEEALQAIARREHISGMVRKASA